MLLNLIKLTRPLNLLIIALTMGLMRYFVIRPMVEVNGFHLQLAPFYFWLLVLSTVLIAAAANVINDFFDEPADRINKPESSIVGVHVKKSVAMAAHQIFNLLGLALVLYVAAAIGNWKLSIISFFAAGSLWFYNVQFKRDLIVGNLIIAVLAGLVPLLVGIYEIPLLVKTYGAEVSIAYAKNLPGVNPSQYFLVMFYFILGYSGFAFILNLIREIQKDTADIEGDRGIQARTIPLVYGAGVAKWIVSTLISITIVGLFYIWKKVLGEYASAIYLSLAVVAPLLVGLVLNFKATTRSQFIRAGNFVKGAMVGGVLYSIVHYFIYYSNAIA